MFSFKYEEKGGGGELASMVVPANETNRINKKIQSQRGIISFFLSFFLSSFKAT